MNVFEKRNFSHDPHTAETPPSPTEQHKAFAVSQFEILSNLVSQYLSQSPDIKKLSKDVSKLMLNVHPDTDMANPFLHDIAAVATILFGCIKGKKNSDALKDQFDKLKKKMDKYKTEITYEKEDGATKHETGVPSNPHENREKKEGEPYEIIPFTIDQDVVGKQILSVTIPQDVKSSILNQYRANSINPTQTYFGKLPLKIKGMPGIILAIVGNQGDQSNFDTWIHVQNVEPETIQMDLGEVMWVTDMETTASDYRWTPGLQKRVQTVGTQKYIIEFGTQASNDPNPVGIATINQKNHS